MLLGEVTAVDEKNIHVQDHAIVHTSPEHAVSLHKLLAAQIEKYRESFGEIRELPE